MIKEDFNFHALLIRAYAPARINKVRGTLEKDNLKTDQQASGFTLVEVLVVMLITFIVLGGVYKALTSDSVDFDREQSVRDMQLNARAALDVIAGDIRKAAFLGCGGEEAANVINNSGTSDPLQTETTSGNNLPIVERLKSSANVDYLGSPLAFVNNVGAGHVTYQENTDVISVRFLSDDIPLTTAMGTSTDNPIQLNANNFQEGDILYITDCNSYSVFQKTDCSSQISLPPGDTATDPDFSDDDDCAVGTIDPQPYNNAATPDLGQIYGLNARVYKLVINTYYIGKDSFAISINDNSNMFSNIEDLQFQYKSDSDNDNDLSDEAWSDTFAATDSVGAVRIYVLARSDQVTGYTNGHLYDYPGSPYTAVAPGDNRYRYLASADVMLRNFNN